MTNNNERKKEQSKGLKMDENYFILGEENWGGKKWEEVGKCIKIVR